MRPNRTSAHSAPRHLQTLHTCLSIPEYTLESNRIDVIFARGNSPSYRTYSNTFAPIREISLTSVDILAAIKHSRNCRTFKAILGAIKQINRTSATVVTSALPTNLLFSNTFRNTKNQNTLKHTYVNSVVNHIRKKLIWPSICKNMPRKWKRGLLLK